MRKLFFLLFFLLSSFYSSLTFSALSYPECGEISDTDFKQVFLIGKTNMLEPLIVDESLNEPIEMALTSDGEGGADIYFTERFGTLKFFDASENTVDSIGHLTVATNADCGLNGIALDPNFKENNWIFLFYGPKISNFEKRDQVFRVSRFTLVNNYLDTTTEKIIIEEIVHYDTRWHSGGSMAFDHYGDLWVSISKNGTDDPGSINEESKWRSCERSSSNTKNLAGGIFRIHPEEDGTYSIPKGNMSDYFNLKYTHEGKLDRAADFRDTSRVHPANFAKGTRNAWSLAVEPVKRWLVWGENGINRRSNHEEFNFTKVPGFFGFPYFAGNPLEPDPDRATTCPDGSITCKAGYNISAWMGVDFKFGYTPERIQNPDLPVNNSKWHDGLKFLPPAIPSIYTYEQNSAMTGPIYRYDGDLNSSVKFPPHFNQMWFLLDFNRGGRLQQRGKRQDDGLTKVAKIDPQTSTITETHDVFKYPTHEMYGVLEGEFGPDGALYLIHYAGWFNTWALTSISRIEYTGDCHPPTPRLEEIENPDVYYPPPGYGCTCKDDTNYDENAFALDIKACANTRQEDCVLKVTPQIADAYPFITLKANGVTVKKAGDHVISLLDIHGQTLKTWNGNQPVQYKYNGVLSPGMYFLSLTIGNHSSTHKICYLP